MKPKLALNKTYLDLEIINKFESFEEFPNTKPVLIADLNGNVVFVNNSLAETYQIREGTNLFDLNTEPKFSKLFLNLSQKKETSFCSDLLIETQDQYYNSYLLNIEKVKIGEEDIFIVFLDNQDNRQKLTKKVNSYNQALESVSVGVLIADENAMVNYISTSFEKYLNVRIEEIYNKNIVVAFNKYLSDFELNELEIAIIDQKNWVKVISDLNSDGEVSYKELRMKVTEDNIDKSINYIITVNDITKHIQQARLIKKSEQRQKSIINNISDPILILRKEKNNLIFENANNSFFKEIVGKKTDLSDESSLELVNPVLHSIIHEAILNLEESLRIHAPFHYTAPKSEKRFLGKITFTDDQYDNTRLYIVNMTDITEQLEIERKLRDAYKKEISLNKLKSTFLANMSHEIRTPLNAIVGYSDLLEDDVKSMNYESSAQMTTYLKDGVNRLLKLVDNIVEVSLLESGNQDIALSNIDLNRLINDNMESWSVQANLSSIKISTELCKNEIIIEANEEKLERALKEIVDNAIKYNVENGKIVLSTFENENFIILQILDNGIGIERDSLRKIFELFEQVEEVG
ncbi:MAG: PAS domain-containing protein, partial [Melioribacteraceae bacterium]|nr:PAS domain-containing protein [Melioribacteraceae bacterium]